MTRRIEVEVDAIVCEFEDHGLKSAEFHCPQLGEFFDITDWIKGQSHFMQLLSDSYSEVDWEEVEKDYYEQTDIDRMRDK